MCGKRFVVSSHSLGTLCLLKGRSRFCGFPSEAVVSLRCSLIARVGLTPQRRVDLGVTGPEA